MSRLSKLVPSFVRRRYLAKFVISILAVVLVIGAVGAVSYDQVDRTVRTDSNEQLEATAEMQSSTIGDWVETMRVQTRTISASQPLAEGETQQVQAHLVEEHARMSVDVRAVHYVDLESGEIVTSTTTELRGESIDDVDEPWATTDIASEMTFDDAVWNSPTSYESQVLGDQVMAFASPVEGRDDRIAVLVGTIEYRVNQLHQPTAASSTIIVDADGNAVLEAENASVDSSDLDDEAIAGALGGRLSLVEGDGVVRAYAPVADTQWVAVTSVPASQAYGVADAVGQYVIAIVLVSLVTLGLVGVILGRQTVVPLERLRDRAAEMERGNLEVDLTSDRIDEIGQLFDGFDNMRTSLKDQIDEAEAARREAERERSRSEEMNRHLERKAEEYREVMEECAAGDLTRRLDPESENEAMTDIAHAFNEMVAELEETTDRVKAFATEVATASEEVTASAEEVHGASEQVSDSIQEISTGADRQNENLQSVATEMNSLSTTTEEIAASSNEVADIAERTAETGRLGREAAQEAIDGMHEIESESTEAVDAIQELEAEMEQIDELIEFISEVARETNMLALNANIEASRGGGGSNGDGFAVVADEVKELAEETKQTAEDIEDRLERIDEKTERTAAEVQETADRIATHVDSVENAADALDEIAEYAQQTNDGVQEISAATEEQAATTQEVVATVSTATEISDRTAAEAEQVAAAAEEQTAALTEVSESASSLSTSAVHLSETLDRFETEGEHDEVLPETDVEVAADSGPGSRDDGDESTAIPLEESDLDIDEGLLDEDDGWTDAADDEIDAAGDGDADDGDDIVGLGADAADDEDDAGGAVFDFDGTHADESARDGTSVERDGPGEADADDAGAEGDAADAGAETDERDDAFHFGDVTEE